MMRSIEQQYYNIILTRFGFPGFVEMMPRAANKGDMRSCAVGSQLERERGTL